MSYTETEYTVTEGEDLEVCVRILFDNGVELPLNGRVDVLMSTENSTAMGECV